MSQSYLDRIVSFTFLLRLRLPHYPLWERSGRLHLSRLTHFCLLADVVLTFIHTENIQLMPWLVQGSVYTGGSQPNINFFYVNLQIFQRNSKVHLSNCLETNFCNISNISLRVTRRRSYSSCEVSRRKFLLLILLVWMKLNEENINFIHTNNI